MPGLAKQLARSEKDRPELNLEGLDLLKHHLLTNSKLMGEFSTNRVRNILRTRYRKGGCEAEKVEKACHELKDAKHGLTSLECHDVSGVHVGNCYSNGT